MIEEEVSEYEVDEDGTYELTFETRIAILTEAGRESESVKAVQFNARASKLEILEAKTILKDREIKVDRSNIEIKEVDESKAFDSIKKAIISFPAVEVGARIYYRYRMKVNEIPLKGFFSAGFSLGLESADHFRFRIRTKKPLFYQLDDTQGLLDLKKWEDRGRTIIEVSNKQKLRYSVVQEDSPFLRPGRLPSIMISTLAPGAASWKVFPRSIIEAQEREILVASAKLPKVLNDIVEKTKGLPAETRMATVSAAIAEGFRYFGDWRRHNGGHIPRPVAEIVETGYGDCKDMSLLVVTIARAMGLKADIAWIWRGDVAASDRIYELPNEFAFNHAVARVEDRGRVFWIDATNPVALPSGKVFSDIGDRPALVLSEAGARFDRTPPMKIEDSEVRLWFDVFVLSAESLLMKGRHIQSGRAGIRAEWALLYSPREQVEYETARWVARNEKIDKYKVTLPESRSRVVRNLEFKSEVELEDFGLRTTAGLGFPVFRNDTIDLLMIDGNERFSDIWLGVPNRYREEYTLRNASVVGHQSLDCNLKSEWAQLSRKVTNVSEKSPVDGRADVRIETIVDVLKPIVPNEAFSKPSFIEFQKQVRSCFNRAALILSVSKKEKPRN